MIDRSLEDRIQEAGGPLKLARDSQIGPYVYPAVAARVLELAMIASRFEQARWLLAEILHRRDWWAAPRHRFYERWSAGDLTRAELQTYAGEHHHAVTALADVSGRAAALAEGMLHQELTRHHHEREQDVDLWCQFAIATGWPPSAAWCYAADPLPRPRRASRAGPALPSARWRSTWSRSTQWRPRRRRWRGCS